ncbi:MAG: hypothetical protein M3144_00735 [Actinomycetota bacterium]|nr:hypothetical protein [Actinomycetota bacterium]
MARVDTGMTRAQKLTPVLVLGIMFLAVGWSLLPFEFAPGVDCGPPLLGGKAKSDVSVGLIHPKEDCQSKAKSRLLTSAMISLAVVAAGTAAIALKPQSIQCLAGRHDECREWWSNALSDNFTGLGCQCECHAGAAYY